MIRIDVLTILPGLFDSFLRESFVGVAQKKDRLVVSVHDLRGWTSDRHRTVDDTPYGGGPGMVMKPEPLVTAVEELVGEKGHREAHVLLTSPRGRRLDQAKLEELAGREQLVMVCARYEGVDQRAIDLAIDEEISVGDYVVSGGEIPAMLMIEGIARLVPGVLGNPESIEMESFQNGRLEAPHYTRPAIFRGQEVPSVLRSGDHGAVADWRREQAHEITKERRPDLIEGAFGEEER
ncbi:MAG: tRNA (guanosine(37)-N1)-methyltransferase TrmD [Myxococcota bacterium]